MSTGTGCVSQYTAAELVQLRYQGGWPYDWLQHERVATLEELLNTLSRRPQLPYLHFDLHEPDECHPANPYHRSPALVRALRRLLQRYRWPAHRLLVVSMNANTLALVGKAMPGVPRGLEITGDFAPGLQAAQQAGVEAMVIRKDLMTPELSAKVKAAGMQVVTFGGRSKKAVKRLVDCNPDAIEVDNVPAMLELLGRPQPAA